MLVGIFILQVIVSTLVILFLLYLLCKNSNTERQRLKIIQGIRDYNIEQYTLDPLTYFEREISFETLEPYNKSLLRLSDWTCQKIVDNETYRKIKPYIPNDWL